MGSVALINRLGGVHINVSHYNNSNDAFLALEMGEVNHPVDVVHVYLPNGESLPEMTKREFQDWFLEGYEESNV